MKSKENQKTLVEFWTTRCKELLQQRNNLSRDDLEYVVQSIEKLKDQRLKECISSLIGWGDEDRAELETFCAISLRVLKNSSPSRIREAARHVEIRYLLKNSKEKSNNE